MTDQMWEGHRTIAKVPTGGRPLYVGVEVTLKDLDRDGGGYRLSVCGVVGTAYQLGRGDAETCGQCIDTIDDIARNHLVDGFTVHEFDALIANWKRWHLNDMRAGTPAQEEFLRLNPVANWRYDEMCASLRDAGLDPDMSVLDDEGNGYKYGSTWLYEALPTEVVAWAKGFQQ